VPLVSVGLHGPRWQRPGNLIACGIRHAGLGGEVCPARHRGLHLADDGRRVAHGHVGMMAKEFRLARKLLVGGDGIPVGKFLETPPQSWF